jgi:predicted transglutaminase-like cysteine proteinase
MLLGLVAVMALTGAAFAIGEVVPDTPVKVEQGIFPPGFAIFCKEHPDECASTDAAVIRYDEWSERVEEINRSVNTSIAYRADPKSVSSDDLNALYERIGRGDVPEGDRWSIDPEFGDCDDYALTKYMQLQAAGIPRGAMSFAYVLPFKAGPHLFLVLHTFDGLMVLDNRVQDVIEMERHPLVRISIQDQSERSRWIALR